MAKSSTEKPGEKMIKARRQRGTVVSNKMEKTVVVRIDFTTTYAKYRKIVQRSTRIKAHTEKDIEVGKEVIIEETKPISKQKSWKVVSIIDKK